MKILHAICVLLCGASACTAKLPTAAPEPDVRSPSASTNWVKVRHAEAAQVLEASARVVPMPGASASLTPPLTARLMRFHVKVGDSVVAGQPLVQVLMPEAVAAAGKLIAARLRLAALAERQRGLDALAKEGLSRLADRIEVQGQTADARGEEQVAKATLSAAGIRAEDATRLVDDEGRTSLRAPITGVVTELDGEIGEQRAAGTKPFARVVDPLKSWIEATFTQAVRTDAGAVFVDASGAKHAVVWANRGLVASAASGSFLAYFTPVESTALQIGSFGRISLDPSRKWWLVPAAAVSTGAEVVLRSGERVLVQVVSRSGNEVVVATDALHAGDEILASLAHLAEAPL